MNRKNILIVTNTLETFGGGERFAFEVSRMLDKKIAITIINPISPNDIKRRDLAELNSAYPGTYKITDIICKSSFVAKGNFLLMSPTINGWITLSKSIYSTDIVYQISMNPFLLASSLLFSKIYHKRFILDLGNPYLLRENERSQKVRLLQRILLSFIPEIHAQTESQLRVLREYHYTGKVHYIPHPLWPQNHKAQSPQTHKEFRCLFVGRLDIHQKGIDLLSLIMEVVITRAKNITFDIVGSGDGQALITAQKARHQDKIRYHGFVSDTKLEELYNEADLFIFPSRFETPGIALLEAQAHGLFSIAFNVQGPKDILKNKIQGILIDPFDFMAFAGAILTEGRSKSPKRREEIKKIIGREYSTRKFKQRFMKMMLVKD